MSNQTPQDPHLSGKAIPPHLRDDSVIGNSPLNPGHPSSQGYKPHPFGGTFQDPKPPKKKHHTFRNIAIVIGGLFALLIVAAVLTPGSPNADAPVSVTSKAGTPVDNGPTPDPITTPTNKPQPSPRVTHKPAPKLTASQEQAIGSAQEYLSLTAFSRKGLIQQLSSDAVGFSVADATFAVDHITVNWNAQAVASAKQYLELTHFSRQGLIRQLESDAVGFTHKQAVYGVTKAGL